MVMTVQEIEEVITKLRALPPDQLAKAGDVIDVLAAQDADISFTPEEMAGIREAQAQVRAGKYASDAEVEAFFAKHRA